MTMWSLVPCEIYILDVNSNETMNKSFFLEYTNEPNNLKPLKWSFPFMDILCIFWVTKHLNLQMEINQNNDLHHEK